MENENAFKHWINKKVVKKLTTEIKRHYPVFNDSKFKLLNKNLDDLELKGRIKLIANNLKFTLPEKYRDALEILMKVAESKTLSNFELWPISEYISGNGTQNFDRSFKALKILTKYFTSEFAIRPYIILNPKKSLKYLETWSTDPNVHIRRLVSEGSRPMLPWGQKLAVFIDKPELTIPLLNKLKYDEELYVRKSVANHLNDISKFKPELVIRTLRKWEESCPQKHLTKIRWIKQHALRTLIKKGNKDALDLIGVSTEPLIKIKKLELVSKSLKIGEKLVFITSLESKSESPQKIVIDYLVYFKKANGTLSPKIFKLKTFVLAPYGKIKIEKKHSLNNITTMKYYFGVHELAIQINGKIGKRVKWELRSNTMI